MGGAIPEKNIISPQRRREHTVLTYERKLSALSVSAVKIGLFAVEPLWSRN
jgi:hypothetical protein